MGYSVEGSQDACYEGTSCFMNKLDIHDARQLGHAEGLITTMKASLLGDSPLPGPFNFSHYKAIHQYLFEDIYAWAGETRRVNLLKAGTNFAPAEDIERVGEALFARMQKELLGAPLRRSQFAKKLAAFYHEANMLHPFRDGNGRTQRAFFTQLIRAAGYDIQFAQVDRDLLTFAVIQAANGVLDHLQAFFAENVR